MSVCGPSESDWSDRTKKSDRKYVILTHPARISLFGAKYVGAVHKIRIPGYVVDIPDCYMANASTLIILIFF